MFCAKSQTQIRVFTRAPRPLVAMVAPCHAWRGLLCAALRCRANYRLGLQMLYETMILDIWETQKERPRPVSPAPDLAFVSKACSHKRAHAPAHSCSRTRTDSGSGAKHVATATACALQLVTVPCGIPCRAGDTVPCGVHAPWDTMSYGIRCVVDITSHGIRRRLGYRAAASAMGSRHPASSRLLTVGSLRRTVFQQVATCCAHFVRRYKRWALSTP